MSLDSKIKLVWEQVLVIVKDNIEHEAYETWFKPLKPVSFSKDVLLIKVPSQFFYEYIESHFIDIILKSLRKVMGRPIRIEYKIIIDASNNLRVNYPTSGQTTNSETSKTKRSTAYTYDRLAGNAGFLPQNADNQANKVINPFVFPGIKVDAVDSQLNAAYTYDNFVEGACNRIAYNAGMQIVEKNGKTPFNPLIIYSDSGLGKTHLVHAIGNEEKRLYPKLNVLCVSAEKFINQFVMYSKSNQVTDFINFYQHMDMLIIDDVHVFAKAEKTQEAFFAIFNHLHQSGKQLVLTLDVPPKDLRGLQDRMLSRFRWGLITELEIPDYDTRVEILKLKMKKDGLDIGKDIIDYIASNVKNNVRELEGTIISLLAQSSFNHKKIDMQLAQKVVKSIVRNNMVMHTIPNIQKLVSSYYNLTLDDLKGRVRKRETVEARHLSMYLIKGYTKNSLKTIGGYFGGRDHTTVIHACQAIENLLKTDEQFRNTMEILKTKLETNKL